MIPTAVQYRSPDHVTSYARPVVAFDAPCDACGAVCPWTDTAADGPVSHCACGTEAA